MIESLKLFLQGRIQGVGFRPLVYQIATSLKLCGYVRNEGGGVEILLQGERKREFIDKLSQGGHHRIDCIDEEVVFEELRSDFEILSSNQEGAITLLPIQDLRICQDCQREILDSKHKRYFYPLINCTNCGPRHSVIKGFPYDRAKTSMSAFVMCSFCQSQYLNPSSRFFHAQPTSCPSCSPKIFWDDREVKNYEELFEELSLSLRKGEIVGIKGIGGFHLVCDATNTQSIQTLRKHKNRPSKPLALMCRDVAMVKTLAEVNEFEEEALCSVQAPIVILKAKRELPYIAPNLQSYGVMLPYTPIYVLLFEKIDFPLVVTSANNISEPICYQDFKSLSFQPHHILTHEREIVYPLEDSIIQFLPQSPQFLILRFARGFAPKGYYLPYKIHTPLLAMGANQKSSFVLAFENLLIVAPYIGDLDNICALERFEKLLEHFCQLYHLKTFEIICDLHPHYQSTKLAFELAEKYHALMPPKQIQHHFAHALSVCYEYGMTHEVLAFCFDGTGYGSDGSIWGGEVLRVSPKGFERVLHFKNFHLLGGERAIKDISRLALALLLQEERLSLDQIQSYMLSRGISLQDFKNLVYMNEKKINSPLSSSVGRIFDAIAWFCGLESSSYEGEGGIYIQELYNEDIQEYYAYWIEEGEIVIDVLEIFEEVILGEERSKIASKFINTLVEIVYEIALDFSLEVVLCGGVFCNQILSAKVLQKLHKANKTCYIGKEIPPNDNGIALGQIYYLLQGEKDAK